jgi:uncharacterized protein involved in type VI secretion and phage assembly
MEDFDMGLTDGKGRANSGTVAHPVIGIVTDNVDPERYGRIRCKFPSMPGEPDTWWLRASSPNAGEGRGMYALPEIGDEVLVVFLQGDQNQGVIIGQHWNGVDLVPEEAEAGMPTATKTDTGAQWSTDMFTDGSTTIDDNDRRFWKSRSGHLFVFDDTDGSETIQMWDKEHNLALVFDTAKEAIFLTNTKGDIHIRTKKNLYLEAGDDIKYIAGKNIEAEAGKDHNLKVGTNYSIDVGSAAKTKAGTSISVKAGTAGSWEGGTTAMLKGASVATVEAAKVDVKGSAMTSISGGLVKIN